MFGVGLVVEYKLKNSVTDFEAINHSLCRIRIEGTCFNYTIMNAHIPTEENTLLENEMSYVTEMSIYMLHRLLKSF